MKTSKINSLTSLLRKTPGTSELIEIIEFLPEATLLVNSTFKEILFSNKLARDILLYNKNELVNLELLSIIPEIIHHTSNKNLDFNKFMPITLIQHSGMQIEVNIKISLLGNQKQWALINFETIQNIGNNKSGNQIPDQNWQAIGKLFDIASGLDNSDALRQILQAGSILTNSSLLGLYLPNKSGNNLKLISGWGKISLLSKIISENEIKRLGKPLVWIPRSSNNKSFQKSSLSSKSNFIATMPIILNSPKDGILLISDQKSAPPSDLLERLKLVVNAYNSFANNSQKYLSTSDHDENFQASSLGYSIENAISDGLILVSEKLKIINLNSTAEASLGYKTSEVKGERIQDILIGLDPIINNIEEIDISESLIHDFGKIRIRRRDSQSILLHIRAMPIFYDDNNILAILISDQSLQEEFLAEANRLKEQALLGELTATFAHEVRNPINNISTSLQLMEIKFPNDNEIQKQIGRMKHDCDRLTVLINSILSYSKTREHKLIPLDFGFFIENLTERWKSRFEKNSIESRLIISEKIPKINAEKSALEQVFTNLISNAVRAMQDQSDGLLVIKVEPLEENGIIKNISIDISDNGPGIPQENQEKIFQPFFTTNTDGTGIGLAVTKRIISSHNGEISLKSFPGGTIFNIKLPVI